MSEVTCPALPKVPVGTYIPANCDDGPMRFHSNCELRCPDGYHIATKPESQSTISRICGTDGKWTQVAVSPKCKGMAKNSFYADCPKLSSKNEYNIFEQMIPFGGVSELQFQNEANPVRYLCVLILHIILTKKKKEFF